MAPCDSVPIVIFAHFLIPTNAAVSKTPVAHPEVRNDGHGSQQPQDRPTPKYDRNGSQHGMHPSPLHRYRVVRLDRQNRCHGHGACRQRPAKGRVEKGVREDAGGGYAAGNSNATNLGVVDAAAAVSTLARTP